MIFFNRVLALALVLFLVSLASATVNTCIASPSGLRQGDGLTLSLTFSGEACPEKTFRIWNNTYDNSWTTGGSSRSFGSSFTSDLIGSYNTECFCSTGGERSGNSFTVYDTSASFDCLAPYGYRFTTVLPAVAYDYYSFNLSDVDDYLLADLMNVEVDANCTVDGLTAWTVGSDEFIVVNNSDSSDCGGGLMNVYITPWNDPDVPLGAKSDEGVQANMYNYTPLDLTNNWTANGYVQYFEVENEISGAAYNYDPLTNLTFSVFCNNYAPILNTDLYTRSNKSWFLATLDNPNIEFTVVNGTDEIHTRQVWESRGAYDFKVLLIPTTNSFDFNVMDFFYTDFTGQYGDAVLLLKRHVTGTLETIYSKPFDTDNWVYDVELIPDYTYQVFISNEAGNREYNLGYVTADKNRTVRLTITSPNVQDYNEKHPYLSLAVVFDCDINQTQCTYNSTDGTEVYNSTFRVYNKNRRNGTLAYNSSSTAESASFSWTMSNLSYKWYVVCGVNHSEYGWIEYSRVGYCGDLYDSSALNKTGLPDEIFGEDKDVVLRFIAFVVTVVAGLAIGGASNLAIGMAAMTGFTYFFYLYRWNRSVIPWEFMILLGALTTFMFIFEKRKEAVT